MLLFVFDGIFSNLCSITIFLRERLFHQRMKQYKIVYRKSECIGAGACEAAFPEGWFFDRETSIATLKSPQAKKTAEREELIIDELQFDQFMESAQVCPVMIIEIYELETNKKVWPEE